MLTENEESNDRTNRESMIPYKYTLDFTDSGLIDYADVIKAGFKIDSTPKDQVYEDTYGYPYKIIYLNLSKGLQLNWHQNTRKCELMRVKKKCGTIISRKDVCSLDELKDIINFWTP